MDLRQGFASGTFVFDSIVAAIQNYYSTVSVNRFEYA